MAETTCLDCGKVAEPGEFHTCVRESTEDAIEQEISWKIARNRDGSIFSLSLERRIKGTWIMKEADKLELDLLNKIIDESKAGLKHAQRRG